MLDISVEEGELSELAPTLPHISTISLATGDAPEAESDTEPAG